jgi:hypothetical protein
MSHAQRKSVETVLLHVKISIIFVQTLVSHAQRKSVERVLLHAVRLYSGKRNKV